MKKNKAVIVGGGSTWTPGLLMSLCQKKDEFPLEELRMFDIDADRQAAIGRYAEVLFRERYPELKFFWTTDKEAAYRDVDFVFCQIRTGGFAMRMLDEQIPLAHGVVGQETCGAGGFAYGLRSIPDMIEIVRDARRYGSDPWILNYTNPAAIVAVALERVFPGDKKIINMCDQPVNLLQSFAKVLGLTVVRFDRSISDSITSGGLPSWRARTERIFCLPCGKNPVEWVSSCGCGGAGQVLAGYLCYGTDYYAGLPGLRPQYISPILSLSRGSGGPVGPHPHQDRGGQAWPGKAGFTECKRVAETGTAEGSCIARSEVHADMIVEVAASIAGNKGDPFIMIVPNDGVIDNFNQDAMVECLAHVDGQGVHPVPYGTIDSFMKGLMEGQYAYEQLTVDAYFERSYKKALQALTLNRTLVDAQKARAVLDDLMDANEKWWPQLV